jgi:hypothetical protein
VQQLGRRRSTFPRSGNEVSLEETEPSIPRWNDRHPLSQFNQARAPQRVEVDNGRRQLTGRYPEDAPRGERRQLEADRRAAVSHLDRSRA